MDYIKGAVTVIILLLPLAFLLCKLWSGRRSFHNCNASRQSNFVASASDSADSNPLPLPFGEYEVFLNFRGPDTRGYITDILYRFLVNLKIRTFKDDDELRKGEGIWTSLVVAIEQSKIYVPIFSENYAYSKWCLRELAAIVERQENDKGCIILPVFYMVDPRDVRNQSGPYHNAFEELRKGFGEETIQVWKDAMNKVGALKGWHIKSNTEQGAIADLVTGVVWSHLSKNNIALETDKLIGIDDHIEAVKSRMALESPSMSIVGIHGMGGIGKTTIVKAVYNKVSAQFDRCSFVENVREMLQQKDGVITLQRHIISNILRVDFTESIANSSEGINIIRDRISRFKFLIVLDDVDEKFEFDMILGDIKNFVSKSRFIITSRNVRVLSTLTGDCKLYIVREMSHHHSLQLFCNHAFKKDSPPPSYETLSKDIVSVAAGLPLTLKIVGSLLFQEEKVIWKDKLRQLREIPEEGVMERLKMSYDTLTAEAKQIFLDIACFFIGEDRELPSYMWSDCGFFPTTNINILIQKSMIEIALNYDGGRKNLFQMHDQLRDMGREIVRQENITRPEKRSRIWSEEKAIDMLRNKKGTNRVAGIKIHHNRRNMFEEKKKLEEIRNESFMKLLELRYLDIDIVPMLPIDDLSNYVPNLRWFRFSCFFYKCLPKFSMENLLILEICFQSQESEALKRIKMASKLKVLKLFRCSGIKFPELPHSGNLEILDLENCFELVSDGVNLDIGNLGNLKVLRLQNCGVRGIICGAVGMIPFKNRRVSHMLPSSLTTLHIKDCPKLERLPSLENLDNLTYLCITKCPSPKEIVGIGELKSLDTLSLSHCGALEKLPSITSLSKLIQLDISYCPLLTEIRGLEGLKSLETLSICDVKAVCNLDGLDRLYSLTSLSLSHCGALETLPNMASLSKLIQLDISYCLRLTEIRGLGGLKSLESLCLCQLPALHTVDSLAGLYSLKILKLSSFRALKTLPTMTSLSRLLQLVISDCPRLTEIRGLEGLKSLQVLQIDGSQSLTRLLGLETLLSFNKLKTVRISSCCLDTSLPFHELDDGRLSEAPVLDSLQELYVYRTTLVLQIFGPMIQLLMLPNLTNLTLHSGFLISNGDTELRLDGLEFMEALVELRLYDMSWKLPSLSKLGKLAYLTVYNDPKLREIEGLAGLKSLIYLHLNGCTALERLHVDELCGLEDLRLVDIIGCRNFIDRSALRKLEPKVKIWWRDSDHLDFYEL